MRREEESGARCKGLDSTSLKNTAWIKETNLNKETASIDIAKVPLPFCCVLSVPLSDAGSSGGVAGVSK